MTDRIKEVAEKIKVAIYFGEHSNVLLLLTALVSETEERWKVAINKCSQPTLCSGSDQLKDKSAEETIQIVHEYIKTSEEVWRKHIIRVTEERVRGECADKLQSVVVRAQKEVDEGRGLADYIVSACDLITALRQQEKEK